MAEDIKLVIGTDNPTIVVTTVDKVNIRDAAKSSEINFVATGSSGIKGDTGPQGPAGTGITTEQAAAIDANTAKNSFDGASINKLNNIEANAQVNRALLDEDNMASDSDTLAPTQQSVKAYVDGQTHLQIGTNSTNALAGNTTTISTEQASAITANTSKTGITTSQASAIVTNTAKTGITTSQASAITANTAKTGITTSQADAITANTAKPDLTVDGAGTVHSNNYTDTVYTHPDNHAISVITGLQTALDSKQDSIGNGDLTIAMVNSLQTSLNGKVSGNRVLTDVPINAVFTDTVYTHPTNHAISVITGLQTALNSKQDAIGSEDLTIQQTDGLQDALDAKVDDSQVLTNVPANAVFTDTVYTHPANHAISVITGLQTALNSKQDGIGSEDLTIAMTDGLQDALNAKVDDSQVLTNVPANAVFTDTNTTYSIQDGELSQNNFTDADHTKLNGIEASADVTDTANVTSSGALMDSELTDLAGVKGVTISTLQVKPSEGGFANGDKTKLDAIEASADVTDAANVTSAGALMDSELTDLAGVKGVTISTLQVKPSEGAFANGDKTKLDSIAANATADQTNVTGSSGTVTSIGNLTGEVVSTNRATTIAKQKEIYFNNFDDKIGTTQLYIPFKSANEQTLPFAEEAAFLTPTDGRVVSVTVRGHIITGSGEVTVSVRTFGLNASVSTSFTIEESKAHDINTADDHHAFHFVFDNAKHFESGELVAIGIKSDTNIDGFPATSFWYATTVVEYDWANQGFTAHQEYDSVQ